MCLCTNTEKGKTEEQKFSLMYQLGYSANLVPLPTSPTELLAGWLAYCNCFDFNYYHLFTAIF